MDFLEVDKASKDYCMSRTMIRFEDSFKQNFVQREIEGAFMAGVKWTLEKQKNEVQNDESTRWHDVDKDPNDLPPIDQKWHGLSIMVWSESIRQVRWDYTNHCWREEINGRPDICVRKWCQKLNIGVLNNPPSDN